jgi:hypothetical protein
MGDPTSTEEGCGTRSIGSAQVAGEISETVVAMFQNERGRRVTTQSQIPRSGGNVATRLFDPLLTIDL